MRCCRHWKRWCLKKDTKKKEWPKNGQALSNVIRRLAPMLRAVHIEVVMGIRTGKNRTRKIRLATLAPERDQGVI